MAEPEKLLLVEGPDDQHTLLALLKRHNFPSIFGFLDRHQAPDGFDELRTTLEARLRAGNQTHLGVIVDADEHLDRRWQSLRDVLTAHGYAPPATPDPDGTVLPSPTPPQEGDTQYRPQVGVWIMPDNLVPGTLENFLARLIPDDDPNWPHAQAAVDNLPRRPNPANDAWHSKARMHTWLAWQREPGKPYGQAITATYLRGDGPQVETLLNWLRQLFVDE